MTPPPKRPACPVCTLPIPAAARSAPAGSDAAGDDGAAWCAGCGWQLRGPHILGALTAVTVEDFDRRVAAAGRQFDLRAVALAELTLAAAEPDIAGRLAGTVRAAPPASGELEAARAQLAGGERPGGARRRAAGGPEHSAAGALPTLTSSVAVALGALERAPLAVRPGIVEVGADAVVLTVVRADELGLPVATEAARWEWHELLPGLPVERYARILRLAGGIGGSRSADPAVGSAAAEPTAIAIGDSVGTAVGTAVSRVAQAALAAEATELVVASWLPPQWPLPERLAAALAGPGPLTTVLPVNRARAWPGESVAAELAATPTRLPYGLVVAIVDEPTGAVTLTAEALFPAGTRVEPGAAVTAEVVVEVPRGVHELALVVVAAPPGARDPRSWQPLAIGHCAAAHHGAPVPIQVTLTDAHQLRFTEPAGVQIAETTGVQAAAAGRPGGRPEDLATAWAGLLADVPDRYGSPPMDLVVLVETGGRDVGSIDTRLKLVIQLLDLVTNEHPDSQAVRVSVLGYGDHDLAHGRRSRDVVARAEALSPKDAKRAVERWQPAPRMSEALVAPLEDALHAAVAAPWRPGARAVLITIGARAPHVPWMTAAMASQQATPCPFEHDWEKDMQQLVARVRPTRVAVRGQQVVIPAAGRPPLGGEAHEHWADRAWHSFGADGLIQGATSPRAVADRAGLLGDAARGHTARGDGVRGDGVRGDGASNGRPPGQLVFPLPAAVRAGTR